MNGDGKVDKTDTTLAQAASGKGLGQLGKATAVGTPRPKCRAARGPQEAEASAYPQRYAELNATTRTAMPRGTAPGGTADGAANPDADWDRDGIVTSTDIAQFGSREYVAALPQGQLAQPGSATQPAATNTTAAARAANARSDFNIGFSGYRFNGDIGAYTVRFRHYDPTPGMCRWLERDPAGYQDGPSLYSYLGRNPMAGTDPYGLAEGGQGGQSGNWIEINEGSIRRVRVDNTWVRGKDGVVTGTVHIAINDTSSPELHKQNRYFYNPDTDTFVNGHEHQLSTRDVARLRGNERFKRELGRRLENLRALAPGKLRFQTFAPGTGKTTFTNTSMLMISALLMLYTASDAVANSPHYARLVSAIKNGSTASANTGGEEHPRRPA